jgi:TrmH family RNA methyltransferase
MEKPMKHLITSLQHPLVKHLVKLRTDSYYRYEQQSVVIEGLKLVRELQGWIKKLIYQEGIERPIAAREEWVVTEALMKKISGMQASEGIIAEMEMPPFSSLTGLQSILALDGINDPGNMGTLLRTALALGWEGIYLLPNSCDPYNEKTVRAARGAQFKLSLMRGSVEELLAFRQAQQMQALVADLAGRSPEQCQTSSRCLLVLGNEAHGASPEIIKHFTKVAIPMPGNMESLNVAVAGGILMYVLKQQMKG